MIKTYFIDWSIVNSLNHVIASIQIVVFPFLFCTDIDCNVRSLKTKALKMLLISGMNEHRTRVLEQNNTEHTKILELEQN